MTERCCETCVHYPPSSFGGKPFSCCNPDDPMTSCWDGRPEGENDCSDSNGYYILDGELPHDLETILDLCANFAGCHTGIVEGAFSELADMLGNLIFDIKERPCEYGGPVVTCGECKFWGRERISCEGLARCNTGESGVRYRNKNDFCSRGVKRES